MAVGYVYVMSNPTMPGLVKIGFTCNDVERRRRELSGATGVPHEFIVEYFRLTEDIEEGAVGDCGQTGRITPRRHCGSGLC